VCAAMGNPAFYPHPVAQVERRDTHISSVFLTGPWVYKIKKPVDFGFLDFSTLEKRRKYCERELRLNARLSADVYVEVATIRERGDGSLCLGQDGRVVEYAVKMRQLPDSASLRELLKTGGIRKDHMVSLGRRLSDFYEHSTRSSEIDAYGSPRSISFNMEENFRQIQPFVSRFPEPDKWEFVRQVSRSFLESRHGLFEHRVQTGRIRDGHGDLRTDHIYFHEGIQIIDCIEFNDRFRYGDVAADVSFLHMDMEHLGYSEWSRALLFAYVAAADDFQFLSLLDFYAAYRAVVRLKVACLRMREVSAAEKEALAADVRLFLSQAYRYAFQFARPTLWVFCGLPASGKSSLAQSLADALLVPLFASDRVRKKGRFHPHRQIVAYGEGMYRPEIRRHVYTHLLALAQETLRGGHSAILDATFSQRKSRDDVRQLAQDAEANVVFVECVCSESTIRQRLVQRETQQGESDARVQHLPEMLADFESLTELPTGCHVAVDTDRSPREAFLEVLSEGYAKQCEQVGKVLRKLD